MTLPEWILLGSTALGTAAGTYKAVSVKLNSAVGKADPGDPTSLRDLIMQLQGNVTHQHDQISDQLEAQRKRIDLIELRVFTPPRFLAVREKRNL